MNLQSKAHGILLLAIGLICAMVFSYDHSRRAPRIFEIPYVEDSQYLAPVTVADSWTAGGTAGGTGGGTGAGPGAGGGSNAAMPELGPKCSCGDVHKLWFDIPFHRGEQVNDLQQGLVVAGFYAGSPDGIFGPATLDALRRFQTATGLEPTGIADMHTWMALGRMCETIVASNLDQLDDQIGSSRRTRPDPTAGGTGGAAQLRNWRAVLIDTSDLTLTVLEDGLPIARYRVGIGARDTPTPVGQFIIVEKAAWAGGFGTRWMGLNVPWGRYGIHGTNKPWSVGQRKSSGCIRMLNRDVEKVYALVSEGTPVVITVGHFGPIGSARPLIQPGAKGSVVYEVQRRLVRMGYLSAAPDGAYGITTERAIMRLQKDNRLPVTGMVDLGTYDALGLGVID